MSPLVIHDITLIFSGSSHSLVQFSTPEIGTQSAVRGGAAELLRAAELLHMSRQKYLAEGDERGLKVISRDVMRSDPAAGDKRSALDASDTKDDDGCAEQGKGVGAVGPNPEQAGTRNKKPPCGTRAISCYGKIPADILEPLVQYLNNVQCQCLNNPGNLMRSDAILLRGVSKPFKETVDTEDIQASFSAFPREPIFLAKQIEW